MDETPRKGLYLAVDDLVVGDYFAVVDCKCHTDPVSIGGLAFKLLAIELPFIVGKLVADPSTPTVTLDTRYLNFMRVSDEFVKAQSPTSDGMVMVPAQLLAMLNNKV